MNKFDNELKNSEFFQQVIAELQANHATLRLAAEQAIAILATAAARQMNANVLALALEGLEAPFADQAPNAARSSMIRLAIDLVRNSGTPARQSH